MVGGECSKQIGNSAIQVSIRGCEWIGETFHYPQTINRDFPAHFVDAQVISNENRHIQDYFRNGDSPIIQSIDLTEISTTTIDDFTNEQNLGETSTPSESSSPSSAPSESSAPSSAPSTLSSISDANEITSPFFSFCLNKANLSTLNNLFFEIFSFMPRIWE